MRVIICCQRDVVFEPGPGIRGGMHASWASLWQFPVQTSIEYPFAEWILQTPHCTKSKCADREGICSYWGVLRVPSIRIRSGSWCVPLEAFAHNYFLCKRWWSRFIFLEKSCCGYFSLLLLLCPLSFDCLVREHPLNVWLLTEALVFAGENCSVWSRKHLPLFCWQPVALFSQGRCFLWLLWGYLLLGWSLTLRFCYKTEKLIYK